MARWLTYVKERFPLPVYALLVGGIACSAQIVAAGSIRPLPIALAIVGLFVFFAELRLMDEYKDYAKDVVAHPTRPLPRGVLARDEVRTVINGGLVLMAGYAVVVGAVSNLAAGGAYAVVVVHLWLMYKEFYVGAWLSARPLLYAFTHQLIVFPLAGFAALAARGESLSDPAMYVYATSVLGAFFAYEVARKLDPAAHPVLKTYLSVYGPVGTGALVVALSLVAAYADFADHLYLLGWPAIAALFLTLPLLVLRPEKFKIVEALATLSLVVHLWAPTVQRIAGWPR